MPTKTAGRKPRHTAEELKRILQGPLELVIDDATSYSLEDHVGGAIPPASGRTLAPLFLGLGLTVQGRDPDELTLYARLVNGEKFRICSGISLIDIAEHAAGIPARPRIPGHPLRVHVPPSRRVVVDPITWEDHPDESAFPMFEAVSILSPTSIAWDWAAGGTADPAPTEFGLEGAEAYWLEEREGTRIGPVSDRSLAPMFLLVGLAREGRDPDRLTLWARLAGGQRFEISRGPDLIELASRTTGIQAHRSPSPATLNAR